MNKIGIRYEDKYVMERRVALVPEHVKILIDKGIEFEVVRSEKRIFPDEQFSTAGATLVDEVTDSDIVIGVKEMPIDYFKEGKTYVFFSHTIKGQPYNMPLLKNMIEKKINLIEYERIIDENGKRLIFFGRFAGLAGMINSLWSVGQRYLTAGIENPFTEIKQTHSYSSLEEAKKAVMKAADNIREKGLPDEITPLVIGCTGYGNVSKGAQEIIDLLPVKEITPQQLVDGYAEKENSSTNVYKVIFKEEDISTPIDGDKEFVLQEYYDKPELFKSKFEQYIPHISILMNCMYWDDKYPRIVTKDYLEKLFENNKPKLTVIGDITCDPDGSIECTVKGTEIEDPVFVYNPSTRDIRMGFEGDGLLIMAVDILPSELPHEASQTFSDALFDYMPEIAKANFNVPTDELQLPSPIKKALILHNGEFTADYKYMKEFLK